MVNFGRAPFPRLRIVFAPFACDPSKVSTGVLPLQQQDPYVSDWRPRAGQEVADAPGYSCTCRCLVGCQLGELLRGGSMQLASDGFVGSGEETEHGELSGTKASYLGLMSPPSSTGSLGWLGKARLSCPTSRPLAAWLPDPTTLRDFWGLSAQAHADQKQKTTASPVCCGRTTTKSHDCSLSAMARTTLREMGDIGISNVCCRSGWHASTDPGRVKQWTTPSG